jgi:predicted glycoside hydrolase/deacetylase ChbG (UPF0249 family)
MSPKRLPGPLIASMALLSCATGGPSQPPPQPAEEKLVILTADDYGASRNINEGIELAAQEGSISEVSALGNFPGSLSGLGSLAVRCPGLGIGVHLNLTTGRPISTNGGSSTITDAKGDFLAVEAFYARIREISPTDVERELRAQIDAVRSAGIPIDHLSDHNGLLSLYPPFFEILAKLAIEYRVAVRSPVAGSVAYRDLYRNSGARRKGARIAFRMASRNLAGALRMVSYTGFEAMRAKAERLDELGIPHPDVLIDYLYGSPTISTALHILRTVPAGVSEIVLHLGTADRSATYPNGLDTGYFDNREHELSVVTSAYLREYAKSLGIRFIRYSDLGLIVGS